MPISLLTNQSSTIARDGLLSASERLQNSLGRLASGSKVRSAAENAGGLAVVSKFDAALKRQGAASDNIANSLSYLQTQDGALQSMSQVLERIGELKLLASDVTKNAADQANYQTEFAALQQQLTALSEERFNGIDLFGNQSLSVKTATDDPTRVVVLDAIDIMGNHVEEFPEYAPDLSDASEFTLTQAGGSGSSAAVGGGAITLSMGTGGIMGVSTQAEFTHPMEIRFDLESTGFDGGVFAVDLDSSGRLLSRFSGSGTTSFRVTVDASGNAKVYQNDSDVPVNLISGLADAPSTLTFQQVGGDTLTQKITGLTVRSTVAEGNYSDVAKAESLSALGLDEVSGALEQLANFRAANGAQQSRLTFAREQLTVNQSNLAQSRSRISDVDIAHESTQLARFNLMQQAGASLLSQANQSARIALTLIG